ncbi:myb-like protein X [Penaeus indicus]|uniref:myb-like protein X n=1 Tax=Penaeus indicus TaxID=29960 RepID=UPI00300C6F39
MESDESSEPKSPTTPKSPKSPKSPTTPTTPTTPDEVKFKSMLQVLLKTKQDDELLKNIEFKEKLEMEEDEEKEEEEDGRKKEKPREKEEQEDERGAKGKEKKERDQGEDGRNNEDKGKIKAREKRSKDEKETSENKKTKETKIKEKHKDKEANKSKEENKNKENKEKEAVEKREKKEKKENKEVKEKEEKETESNNNKENKGKGKDKKKQNEEEEEKKSKKGDTEIEAKEREKKTDQKKNDEAKESKEELKEKDKAKKREDETREKDTKKKEDKPKEKKVEEKIDEKPKEKKNEEKTKEKKHDEKPKEKKNEEKTKEKKIDEKTKEKKNEEKTKENEEKRKEGKPAEKREVNVPRIEVDEVTSGQETDAAVQGRPSSSSSSSTASPARSTSTLAPHPSSSSTKAKGEEGGRAEEKVMGILYKKGKGPFGSWKRYYFVLKGQLLMYYYSEHDYKELSSFKGSLDLTMLEEVREKKKGFMKSHFPFALGRRNLKHIVLAAETSEERDQWMSVLRSSLLRPTGGSVNRSDSNIPAPREGDSLQEKSATLPARAKNSPASSSLSESEDEAKKDEGKKNESKKHETKEKEAKEEEAKEEEAKEDEEPKLIQPKKVQRIPMSPMGQIKIDAVKLRKVDRKPLEDKADRDKVEGEAAPEELDPETKFGVKLKKHHLPVTSATRGDVGEAKEAKEEAQGTKEAKEEAQGTKETKETSLTPSSKRPNKNPIIPLGKSPLLSRPEGELLKTSSPETQRRGGTPERKKSPSPSIPLSRGVHSVLAKSGEEGDERDEREDREGREEGEEKRADGVDARGEVSREKSATLPARAKNSPASSSLSESEDEAKKDEGKKNESKKHETKEKEAKEEEAKEEEAKEDEEPKLIQPKKVQRIPMSPMGQIKIDAVKLRKVDRKPLEDKADRDKVEGDAAPEELDPETKFGVKLKKHHLPVTSATRGDVGEAKEAKEEPQGTKEAKEEAQGTKEAKETSLTPSSKRPNKNPIIPLGKSPLLSRPEGELLKTSSPETQRRGGTPERKKSPSPSIPLSRGVHSVLAKSGEEGDERDEREDREGREEGEEKRADGVDARGEKNATTKPSRSPSPSSSSESEKEDKEEKEEKEEKKEKEKEENKEKKDQEKEKEDKEQKARGISVSPEVPMKPKKTERQASKDAGGREDRSEEEDTPKALDRDAKSEERTPGDSGRVSGSASPEAKEDSPSSLSSASRDQDLSSQGSLSRQGSEGEFLQVSVTLKESAGDESEYDQLDEDVLRSVKPNGKASEASPKPPSPRHTPSSSETSSPASIRTLEENEKPRLPKQGSCSAGATPPRSPFRRRSNTNDSSGSCKSEPETPEKKSGKLKALFTRGRSGSLDVGRPDCGKGDYEVKGKNSSAFSKFLQKKLSKEKIKKEIEGSSPEMRKNSETAKDAAPAEPVTPREAREAGAPSTPKEAIPTVNVVPILPEESEGPEEAEVAVTLRSGFQASGESRGSTYSRSSNASREQDPPPTVPEKTRIREKSPVHDIPRSNRPVPAAPSTPKEEPRAVEGKVVDGNISLEQINAILSAKESKKRQSREREGSVEGDAAKGLSARRPSSISTTSVESDDPLPKTNFIDCDISSSSSGSLKDQVRSRDSVGSGDHVRLSVDLESAADAEASVTLRKPKLTDSLTAGPRVSLTQPEFTVVEEDAAAASPETERQTRGASPDDRRSESDVDDDGDDEDEEAEQSDYFPGVGAEVRPPSPTSLKLPDSPTLNITRLKAFLGEMEKEDANPPSLRTGISRLGHSAAVEKLKEEITEEPRD